MRRAAASGPRALWCFSVGGVNPRGRITGAIASARGSAVSSQQFPAGLMLRDHRVFGGIVAMAGVPLWGRVFYRMTGGRPGDHRDWPAVDAWAAGIADALSEAPSSVRDRGRRPPEAEAMATDLSAGQTGDRATRTRVNHESRPPVDGPRKPT